MRAAPYRPVLKLTPPPHRRIDVSFWGRVRVTRERVRDRLGRFLVGGCWIWVGRRDKRGYGRCLWGRKPTRTLAHRYAWIILVGPPKAGYEIDHLCRIQACVNPNHMEEVTHSENVRRAGLFGVALVHSRRTHCPAGHPYNKANTYFDRWANGRRCRRCLAKQHGVAARRLAARRRRASGS